MKEVMRTVKLDWYQVEMLISIVQSDIIQFEYGDDLGTIGAEDPLIAGLSSSALAAAAARYLTETNRARFVLLPEGR